MRPFSRRLTAAGLPLRHSAVAGLPLLLLLSACGPTLDELKERQPLWTATVAVPFDTLANCIVARSVERYTVTPQIHQREGVAYVTLIYPAANQLQGEYTVRWTGEGTSSVEYRGREPIADLGGSGAAIRASVERCSKPPG